MRERVYIERSTIEYGTITDRTTLDLKLVQFDTNGGYDLFRMIKEAMTVNHGRLDICSAMTAEEMKMTRNDIMMIKGVRRVDECTGHHFVVDVYVSPLWMWFKGRRKRIEETLHSRMHVGVHCRLKTHWW